MSVVGYWSNKREDIKMLTGNLQIKKDTYYAVINFKQGEKYKQKWISTKLKTKGNKRKAV